MRPEAGRNAARPQSAVLQVGAEPRTGLATLMTVPFDGAGESDFSSGLAFLGGDLKRECWQVDALFDSGLEAGIHWRRAGGLLLLGFKQADDGLGDPAEAVDRAYRNMLDLASRFGCESLLRCWNFMPSINAGQGDHERYRRFCLGRASALESAGYGRSDLCAGTAIGSADSLLRIYILCGAAPGVNIENPRQVSAYQYPRCYGPRSPSFARATAIEQSDDSALLMISGTASVVGHRTLHEGDLGAQLDEIVANISVLLAESARQLQRPGLAGLDRNSLLRAYVRHTEHWPRVQAALATAWPDSPVAGLHGDICRSDLLVEVEAVTRT